MATVGDVVLAARLVQRGLVSGAAAARCVVGLAAGEGPADAEARSVAEAGTACLVVLPGAVAVARWLDAADDSIGAAGAAAPGDATLPRDCASELGCVVEAAAVLLDSVAVAARAALACRGRLGAAAPSPAEADRAWAAAFTAACEGREAANLVWESLPDPGSGSRDAALTRALLWSRVTVLRRQVSARPLDWRAWRFLAIAYMGLHSSWADDVPTEAEVAGAAADVGVAELWPHDDEEEVASAGGPLPRGLGGAQSGSGLLAAVRGALLQRSQRAVAGAAAASLLVAAASAPPPPLHAAASLPREELCRRLDEYEAPSAADDPFTGAAERVAAALLGPRGRLAAARALAGLDAVRHDCGLAFGLGVLRGVDAEGRPCLAVTDAADDATHLSDARPGPAAAAVRALASGCAAACALLSPLATTRLPARAADDADVNEHSSSSSSSSSSSFSGPGSDPPGVATPPHRPFGTTWTASPGGRPFDTLRRAEVLRAGALEALQDMGADALAAAVCEARHTADEGDKAAALRAAEGFGRFALATRPAVNAVAGPGGATDVEDAATAAVFAPSAAAGACSRPGAAAVSRPGVSAWAGGDAVSTGKRAVRAWMAHAGGGGGSRHWLLRSVAARPDERLWPTAEVTVPMVWAGVSGKLAKRGLAAAVVAHGGAARRAWALEAAAAVAAQAVALEYADEVDKESALSKSRGGRREPSREARIALYRLHATRTKLATMLAEGAASPAAGPHGALEDALAPLLDVMEATACGEAARWCGSRDVLVVTRAEAEQADVPRSGALAELLRAEAAAHAHDAQNAAEEAGAGAASSCLVPRPALRLTRPAALGPFRVRDGAAPAGRASSSLLCRCLLVASDAQSAMRRCLGWDKHFAQAGRSLAASLLAVRRIVPRAAAACRSDAATARYTDVGGPPGTLSLLILEASPAAPASATAHPSLPGSDPPSWSSGFQPAASPPGGSAPLSRPSSSLQAAQAPPLPTMATSSSSSSSSPGVHEPRRTESGDGDSLAARFVPWARVTADGATPLTPPPGSQPSPPSQAPPTAELPGAAAPPPSPSSGAPATLPPPGLAAAVSARLSSEGSANPPPYRPVASVAPWVRPCPALLAEALALCRCLVPQCTIGSRTVGRSSRIEALTHVWRDDPGASCRDDAEATAARHTALRCAVSRLAVSCQEDRLADALPAAARGAGAALAAAASAVHSVGTLCRAGRRIKHGITVEVARLAAAAAPAVVRMASSVLAAAPGGGAPGGDWAELLGVAAFALRDAASLVRDARACWPALVLGPAFEEETARLSERLTAAGAAVARRPHPGAPVSPVRSAGAAPPAPALTRRRSSGRDSAPPPRDTTPSTPASHGDDGAGSRAPTLSWEELLE